jgi:neutral ceramidase
MELSGQPGKGRGKFDATLRYYKQLEDAIVDTVVEADARLQPARLDGQAGKPIATIVNFTAHPTSIPAETLKFSADYAGALKDAVRRETGGEALFLQGAAGDQSADRGGSDYRAFGDALGREAVKFARTLSPRDASGLALAVREDRFQFTSRFSHSNPVSRFLFERAFFPELVANYVDEYAQGVRPRLTVATLGDDIAMVAVSGEFFSTHATRLKERARVPALLFAGFANGYHQYFPTIEAVAEGGYGADAPMAPAELGAGEHIMNTALSRLYELRGKIR